MTNAPEYQTGERRSYDEKSRDYPIRALLDPTAALVSKSWPTYADLNQGSVGACVGGGWANELAADPVSIAGVNNDLLFRIYHEAQKIDEWPGENYEGTSVLAGAKVIQSWGFMPEYRWAFGIDDVVATVSQYGPVIFGLNWYQSMFSPAANGQLVINGASAGGHCIDGDEIDLERGRLWLLNDWTRQWGIQGRAWLALEDLDKLLRQGGVACVPVKRDDPSAPPTPPPPDPSPRTIPFYVGFQRYDFMSDGSTWVSSGKYDAPPGDDNA